MLGLSTRHQAYRSIRTFLRWTIATESLQADSLQGRNRALILVMADAGTPTTARSLKEYLATSRILSSEDLLFADARNQSLGQKHPRGRYSPF